MFSFSQEAQEERNDSYLLHQDKALICQSSLLQKLRYLAVLQFLQNVLLLSLLAYRQNAHLGIFVIFPFLFQYMHGQTDVPKKHFSAPHVQDFLQLIHLMGAILSRVTLHLKLNLYQLLLLLES